MAPKVLGTLHYLEETAFKAHKALIAAKFNGVSVPAVKFDAAKVKPEVMACNPTGNVPFLETDMGCLFTSNSIARYVARSRADTPIYGKCFNDEGSIDTWLEFATHELEVPLFTWLYPTMGLMPDEPEITEEAKQDVCGAMATLEARLASSDFLVGDFLTLADIVVVCSLREGFTRVFEPAFRKPFPKTCAWFDKCCAMAQFKAVFGDTKLCSKAAAPMKFVPPPRTEASKPVAKAKPEPKAKSEPKAKAKANTSAPASAAAAAPSVASEDQVKAVGDEIRKLKEKLKGEGLSGKQINDHDQIKILVAKLNEMKAAAPAASPATSPATAPPAAAAPASGGDAEDELKAVGDEIRALKEKLKGEGLSGKKVNEHPAVKELVAKLTELKAGAPAAAPTPPAPAAAIPAPATESGGDIEAQTKAVGDQIRALKEKLKGEGLSGKKVNEHPEVKELVAKLTELKNKA